MTAPAADRPVAQRLRVRPLELVAANQFVEAHHRHHGRTQGHRFSIGCYDESGALRGCAIVGRPTSGLDPTRVLEVTRLCTDGARNACSVLYAAAARAGRALGYERIQTYIFESEHGTSLLASGWRFERKAHASGRHRRRTDGATRDLAHVAVSKTLWVKDLAPNDGKFAHHRDAPLLFDVHETDG